MSSRPASWKTPCTSWTWRPGGEDSLSGTPDMTIGAPIQEERELRTLDLSSPQRHSSLPCYFIDGETEMSTQAWSLVQGPSPSGQSRANHSFLRFGPAGFPRHFPSVGPWTSHFTSLSLFPHLCLPLRIVRSIYQDNLLLKVPSYSKCSMGDYILLLQCAHKENSGPDFSLCWLVCLLPPSLYSSFPPSLYSLSPFLPPSLSLSLIPSHLFLLY